MKAVFYFLILNFLLSCNHKEDSEFKKSGNNFFKLVELGEEQTIEEGKFVQAYVSIQDIEGDTIHYVPHYPYFFQIQQSEMDSLFLKLNLGDSAIFIVEQKKLKEYFAFFHLKTHSKRLAKVHVRILNIYNGKKESLQSMTEMLKQRKKNEAGYFNHLLKIKSNELDTLNEGLYIEVIREGNGNRIKKGREVNMEYRAMFLNGYEFENTFDREEGMTFVYGNQHQLIEGINIGLKDRNEGDKLKFFISSQLGFGDKGSIAGIVPPFTSLIYEIEIKKVKD